jgi:hypothetical protein
MIYNKFAKSKFITRNTPSSIFSTQTLRSVFLFMLSLKGAFIKVLYAKESHGQENRDLKANSLELL